MKCFIDVCFFVDLRQCSGCPVHQSHPRFIDPTTVPLPTRLLTSDQIDNIVHVVNAMSNNGTACNYLHGKFGKFINLMKAAYLCRRANGDLNSPKDDINLMMNNLVNSNEISFMSLLDVPFKEYFHEHDKLNTSGLVNYREIEDSSEIFSLLEPINEE